MDNSYDLDQIAEWQKLTPEARLLAAEELWEEFRVKHPQLWEPFHKSFDSFEAYQRWLQETGNPTLF